MKKELRTVVYDEDLHIEAYRFEGFVRPFPNHFHEYYVIGYLESGQRALSCMEQEYSLRPGNILLFNPGDSHACAQSDGGTLDYRGLNLSKEVLLDWMEAVDGAWELPVFSPHVILDTETASCLRTFHELVMNGFQGPEKEESLLLLVSLLVQKYGQSPSRPLFQHQAEVEAVCAFIQDRYAEHISLDQLCRCAGLSRSTLLRAFTRAKGVTPTVIWKMSALARPKSC